jgi:hypothetical protein
MIAVENEVWVSAEKEINVWDPNVRLKVPPLAYINLDGREKGYLTDGSACHDLR